MGKNRIGMKGTITWEPLQGQEATVTFSENWEKLPKISKLDCLHGVIEMFENKYQDILKNESFK